MAAVDWPLSAMHKSPEGELLIETSREGPYSLSEACGWSGEKRILRCAAQRSAHVELF